MHTGNINTMALTLLIITVYPCAYREHSYWLDVRLRVCGLSLCIQGTYPLAQNSHYNRRFIPVHTGNIVVKWSATTLRAVYPCAYREHLLITSVNLILFGLSLCIQGTSWVVPQYKLKSRFIPVHTGNMWSFRSWWHYEAVYPCAYREHMHQRAFQNLAFGLSLCIQGTYQL